MTDSNETIEQRSVRVFKQMDALYRKRAEQYAIEAEQLLARNDGMHNMHGHAAYLRGLPKQERWITYYDDSMAERMIKSMRIADRTKKWPSNEETREYERLSLRIENERLVFARAELLEALRPFAMAAKEVRRIGVIRPDDQFLWKPNQTGRETAGISAAHLLKALQLFNEHQQQQ